MSYFFKIYFLVFSLIINLNASINLFLNIILKILMYNYLENQSLLVNQSQCDIYGDSSNQVNYNNNIILNVGYWTKQEQFYYYNHIKENFALYESTTNKRVTKIFKALAQKMKTRLPHQVRSHHQKMIKKYQTLENLMQQLHIQYFGDKTGTKQMQQQIIQKQSIKQQQQQLSNLQTVTNIYHQQQNVHLTRNRQDEILQTPIGNEDQQLFYDYIKQSNSAHYQIFTTD